MQPLPLISGTLTCLYGILNAFAGLSQLKVKEIRTWSAWFMLGSGLLLVVSGVILALKLPLALFTLTLGLIAIHLLTINNGLKLYGKINPGHHLFRLAISAILFSLAFWSRR